MNKFKKQNNKIKTKKIWNKKIILLTTIPITLVILLTGFLMSVFGLGFQSKNFIDSVN